jgi:4-hydroxythreonine-4-phosphate dehydrogenase
MSNHPAHPHLAIALGDPAGIGAEVTLKALADPALLCQITLFGNLPLLRQAYKQLPPGMILNPDRLPPHITLQDIPITDPTQITLGSGSAASGAASFQFLEAAIAHTLSGASQAIVTAPISKSTWKAAGHHYPGQTELLAEKAHSDRFGMMFVGRSPHTGWTLRALLATTHIPLRQVPDTLTPTLLTRKLDLLIESLQKNFAIPCPRIALAGLNPHSGEQGQLGTEEIDWMIPWLEEMRDRYPHTQLDGLFPPDTMWVRPAQHWYGQSDSPAHDAYLALYHDQGLIPVKLMAFDRAVNTTIGLPFIRTSPDHGTAFDIAGQGIADANSMKAAVELAIELSQSRQTSDPRSFTDSLAL